MHHHLSYIGIRDGGLMYQCVAIAQTFAGHCLITKGKLGSMLTMHDNLSNPLKMMETLKKTVVSWFHTALIGKWMR